MHGFPYCSGLIVPKLFRTVPSLLNSSQLPGNSQPTDCRSLAFPLHPPSVTAADRLGQPGFAGWGQSRQRNRPLSRRGHPKFVRPAAAGQQLLHNEPHLYVRTSIPAPYDFVRIALSVCVYLLRQKSTRCIRAWKHRETKDLCALAERST